MKVKNKKYKNVYQTYEVSQNMNQFNTGADFTGRHNLPRLSGQRCLYGSYRRQNRRRRNMRSSHLSGLALRNVYNGNQALSPSTGKDVFMKSHTGRENPPAPFKTMQELYVKYMAEHAIHKKTSSAANDVIYWEKHILPRLGQKPVRFVTRSDISQLHNSIGQEINFKGQLKTTTANRVLEVLKKAFSLAEEWEWRPDGTNPCRQIKKFKEIKRRRYLSAQEAKRLYSVLSNYLCRSYRERQVARLVLLLLLTGARKNEIMQAKWSYVCPERSVLALPDTKSNGPQDLILPAEAFNVLADIQADQANNQRQSEYIFDGRIYGQSLKDEGDHWNNIREDAGLEDFRMHDLRHSFASFMAMTTGSQVMIKEALRHSDVKTSDRYTHMFNDPLRLAVNRTADKILQVMHGGKIISPGDIWRH